MLVLLLAVPELTWAWDTSLAGAFGLISRAEGVWTVVILAATVPASIVVSDRRDGLVLLLRLRGLGPTGYLSLRAGIAAAVAFALAVTGLGLSLVGLVVVLGPADAGTSGFSQLLPEAAPLLTDAFTILVAGLAAAGLAASASVIGSVVQVPVVPNLMPLAGFIAAAWLESLLPAPLSRIAEAASVQLRASPGGATMVDILLPLAVWPAVGLVLVGLVGPRQESLWRR
jgi:hypothetical protein